MSSSAPREVGGIREMGTIREIAVVEMLGGFGDLLLVLPSIHALARRFPDANVRVVTLAPGDNLLAADPAVASVTVADADDAAAGLAAHLDAHPADLAVSTTMHSGIVELLEARVPRAVTNLWRRPPADEPVERRFLRLLADDGLIDPADAELPLRVVLTEDELQRGAEMLPGRFAEAGRPVLALPGAGMPVKRWPAERWYRLVETLHERGMFVVTVPDGADLPGAHVLPAQDLRGFAATVAAIGARGGIAIGGDTGPARLPTPAGTPAGRPYRPTPAPPPGPPPPAGGKPHGL